MRFTRRRLVSNHSRQNRRRNNRRRLRRELLECRRLLAASLGMESTGDGALVTRLNAEGEDQTFVVTTLNDELDLNPGDNLADLSLREAIELANELTGRDTITFAQSLAGVVEIDAALGQFLIEDTVDVLGPGADVITLDAMDTSRVFQLSADAGDVLIEGLTVTGGRTTGDLAGGAGIRSLSTGTLTIRSAVITGNSTSGQGAAGAGVLSGFSISNPDNPGSLTIIDSLISDNQTGNVFSGGGGVFSGGGTLKITGSTISGNQTLGGNAIGGGVYTTDTDITIVDSTISGNSTLGAASSGGGLATQSSTIEILTSTVSGNSTAETNSRGGGIFASRTDLNLASSTLSGNTTAAANGGGLYASRGAVDIFLSTITGNASGTSGGGVAVATTGSQVVLTVDQSIIAGNTDTSDSAPDIQVGDSLDGEGEIRYSLIGDNTGTGLSESQTNDLTNTNLVGDPNGAGAIDPLLGRLADNGGDTLTHALLGNSPAVDAGDPNLDLISGATDQRGEGFARIANSIVDIGSFEQTDAVPATLFDFGDASDVYPVLLSDNGARHTIGSQTNGLQTNGLLTIGANVDEEADGQPSVDGSGDGDDPGDIIPVSDFVTVSGSATLASYVIDVSGVGKLDAWIDFNQDGDWDDAGEQIYSSVDVDAGTNLLSFEIPSGAIAGNTFARFRLSSAGGLSPVGPADDGEVEDLPVTILDGTTAQAINVSVSGDTASLVTDSGQTSVRFGDQEVVRVPVSGVSGLTIASPGQDMTLTINIGAGFSIPGDGLNLIGGSDTSRLVIVGDGGEIDLTANNVNLTNFGILDLSSTDLNAVTVDAATVDAASPATSRLSILIGEPTPGTALTTEFSTLIVSEPTDWRMTDPVIVDGQFRLTAENIAGGGEVIEVLTPAVWQNILQVNDVSNNGVVTALDALQIINELSNNTFSDPATGLLVDPTTISDFPGRYFDQNGDGQISALDALRVINELARQDNALSAEAESITLGEGEFNANVVPVATRGRQKEDDKASAADLALNQLF